jgi:hypothetical protein
VVEAGRHPGGGAGRGRRPDRYFPLSLASEGTATDRAGCCPPTPAAPPCCATAPCATWRWAGGRAARTASCSTG